MKQAATAPPIIPDIVRQHVEQAAFFWAQRDTLMAEDPPDVVVVAGVDRRLEANLDGVRIAGSAAWPLIVAAYDDFPEKGELFLYGWMAIERSEGGRVAEAVELGRATEDDARGLIGALAWHKAKTIAPLVRDWISSPDSFKRFLGVSACVEHGVDPKQMLARLIRDPDMRVRAAGLRLAGKFKRSDLVHELRNALSDEHERPRFWAAWSLTELGAGDIASPELRKIAASANADALTALRAAIKAAPDPDVKAWLGGLLKKPETAALAVRGAGMLGDRTVLHWLIHQMRTPALAKAAGAALLELFPEAREAEGLFTLDPTELGQAFEDQFGDFAMKLPVAASVKVWSDSMFPKQQSSGPR